MYLEKILVHVVKMRTNVAAALSVLWNRSRLAQTRSINAHSQWHSGIRQYGMQRHWTCSKPLQNYASVRLASVPLYAMHGSRSENSNAGEKSENSNEGENSNAGEKSEKIDVIGLSEVIAVDNVEYNMRIKVETLRNLLAKNLSLMSTTAPVENLPVIFQGTEFLLRDVAKVEKTKNPMSIELNMSEFPHVAPAVLQAIRKSRMNLNPQQHGTSIFLSPVPIVTIEDKANLNRNALALFQRCQGGIKDIETKCIKEVVRHKEKVGLDVDTAQQMENQIKLIAKTYMDEALELLDKQESELRK